MNALTRSGEGVDGHPAYAVDDVAGEDGPGVRLAVVVPDGLQRFGFEDVAAGEAVSPGVDSSLVEVGYRGSSTAARASTLVATA